MENQLYSFIQVLFPNLIDDMFDGPDAGLGFRGAGIVGSLIGQAIFPNEIIEGKMAAKQDYRVFHDYWRAFRRDFGQATCLWVLFALLGLLILADYQLGLANSGALGGILIAVARLCPTGTTALNAGGS